MFIGENPVANMFSCVTFLIFAIIVWPAYLSRFVCLFFNTQPSLITYIGGIVLEVIILTPISFWLDSRYDKQHEKED